MCYLKGLLSSYRWLQQFKNQTESSVYVNDKDTNSLFSYIVTVH